MTFELLVSFNSATKIDEIADLALVARRTFFRYFATKEEVLVAWMDKMSLDIQAKLIENLITQSPYQALVSAIMEEVTSQTRDRQTVVNLSRLIDENPSVRILQADKHARWAKSFAGILMKHPSLSKDRLKARLLSARAVDALVVAGEIWREKNFRSNPNLILEKAFQLNKMSFD